MRLMSLSDRQRKFLRQLGHDLKPVVWVGNAGLTPAVEAEVDAALSAHELIKVKVRAGERHQRDTLIEALASHCRATLVQRIGHVALLFRPEPDRPRISLPRP